VHEKTKKLAEESGFIFWADEDWKPEGEVIDWSSNYDNELENLVELVVQECISQIALVGISNFENDDHGDISWTVSKCIEMIQKKFGVKE
jgi:hypothetical protein